MKPVNGNHFFWRPFRVLAVLGRFSGDIGEPQPPEHASKANNTPEVCQKSQRIVRKWCNANHKETV